MALALTDVRELLATQSLAREITDVQRGSIRIETGFVYPDGTSIEIFVEPPADLCDAVARLSDFGQTTAWLLNVQVRPWQSRKRSAFLEDALRPYDVEQREAELVYVLKDARDLPTGVLRLGQACVRVADLIFTRRARLESVNLLAVHRDEAGEMASLDAHPLVREYFGRQLRETQPESWKAAHRRLYEHLCATTQEGDRPTLEDLQPLYQAVAHGCQAGLQQEAFARVFFARLDRRRPTAGRNSARLVRQRLPSPASWRHRGAACRPRSRRPTKPGC